jgi:hypothetical protein
MTDPKEARYVVVTAVRPRPFGGATVGYFKTRTDIPPGWKFSGQDGIDDIMESLATTDVDRCLRMMNSHWQK